MASCIDNDANYNECSPSYANLPWGVLLHIFRYLNYSDQQVAELTCSSWRQVLLFGEFNRNIVVRLTDVTLSDRLPAAQAIIKSQRQFRSFRLENLKFNDAKQFFTHIGKRTTEIIFYNAEIEDNQFYAIMKQLTHLESLTLTNCSSIFIFGEFLDFSASDVDSAAPFSKIKHLYLSNNQYLSDSILQRLTSYNKGIETLDVSGCNISYHTAITRRFYPNDPLILQPNEYIFTFKFITQVAKSHRKYLKDLNLSRTQITGEALQTLASTENCDDGLSLLKLRLAGCTELDNNRIMNFLVTQSNLVLIDLSGTSCVIDMCLVAIAAALPKLETLNVSGCTSITDNGVMQLGNLKHLKSLNISRCSQITRDGLTQGIARSTNSVLRTLLMSHLSDVCEQTIMCIASNCPELRILNLDHCAIGVTDSSVQSIIKQLRWLRELSLEGCYHITDAALTGITTSNVHQEFDKYPNNNPNITDHLMNDGFPIHNLRGLRKFNLNGCNNITDLSVMYGLKFIELQRLCLSNCQQITLVGMEALVVNCPAIEVIYLCDCSNINEKSMEVLTTKLSRLRELHVTGCKLSQHKGYSSHIYIHIYVYSRIRLRGNVKLQPVRFAYARFSIKRSSDN